MNWDQQLIKACTETDGTLHPHTDHVLTGAKWQRDQLRTDEAIELVARGILYSEFPGDEENCDYHWKFFSDHYLKQARTAITALLGGA